MHQQKAPQKITDIIDYQDFDKFLRYLEACHKLSFDMTVFETGAVPDLDDIELLKFACFLSLNHFLASNEETRFETPTEREDLYVDFRSDDWEHAIVIVLAHYLNYLENKRNNNLVWWYNESNEDIEWYGIENLREVL